VALALLVAPLLAATGCVFRVGNEQIGSLSGAPTEISPGLLWVLIGEHDDVVGDKGDSGAQIRVPMIPYILQPITIRGARYTPQGPVIAEHHSSLLGSLALEAHYRRADYSRPLVPIPKVREQTISSLLWGLLYYGGEQRVRTERSLREFDQYWESQLQNLTKPLDERKTLDAPVPEFQTRDSVHFWGSGLLWMHGWGIDPRTGEGWGVSGPLFGCIGWSWDDEGSGPAIFWFRLFEATRASGARSARPA
jgi:hypothetical protein